MAIRQNRRLGDEQLDIVGAAVSTALAATINKRAFSLTTESLSTAAGSAAVFVLTVADAEVGDLCMLSLMGGTNTAGSVEEKAVVTAGTITVTFTNRHASAAFNGTLIFAVQLIKIG